MFCDCFCLSVSVHSMLMLGITDLYRYISVGSNMTSLRCFTHLQVV